MPNSNGENTAKAKDGEIVIREEDLKTKNCTMEVDERFKDSEIENVHKEEIVRAEEGFIKAVKSIDDVEEKMVGVEEENFIELEEKLLEEKIIKEKRLAMKKDRGFSNRTLSYKEAWLEGNNVRKQLNSGAATENDENLTPNNTARINKYTPPRQMEEHNVNIEVKEKMNIEKFTSKMPSAFEDQFSSESSEEEEEEDPEWWKEKKQVEMSTREEEFSDLENNSTVDWSDSSFSDLEIVLSDLSDDEEFDSNNL